MTENAIARDIVDAAIEVHRTLGGPGLLESVYEEALKIELELRGHHVLRQKVVQGDYKGHRIQIPLRFDLLVDETVLVDCKALDRYHNIHEVKALTYIRLLDKRLAIVVNFGERLVKDGIHRVVNGLRE